MAKFLKSTGGGVNDSIGLETVAESGCIGISRADECWLLLEAVAERAPGRVGRDEMWWPGQAPGKTWDGGIVASLGAVGTLGTCSTVGTVVTLELPHMDVYGSAPLWDGARKVGEGRVVVVGWTGFGWLRVEMFWPVVGAPTFFGPQYRYMGQPVSGVGDH